MDVTIAHIEKELYKFKDKMIIIRFDVSDIINRMIIIEKETFIRLMKYFLKLSCQIKIDNEQGSINIHIMEKMSEKKLNRHIDDLYKLCSNKKLNKYYT